MIGAVGQNMPVAGSEAMGPGRKMQSVGHLAKAAVSAALEAGAELPKNAQGIAASALAHGADAESIFAAMLDTGDTTGDTPDGGGEPNDGLGDIPADSVDGAPPSEDGADSGVSAADDGPSGTADTGDGAAVVPADTGDDGVTGLASGLATSQAESEGPLASGTTVGLSAEELALALLGEVAEPEV